jgi:beta-1,4-mannooligosaccharide/beta-1,4-mannosyl-N-acetylglucosamine phosphorylase
MDKRVFIKHPANPVVKPTDLPEGIMYVLNPGAIQHNGETILMMDAATLGTPIVLWLARSKDGVSFTPDPAPVQWPRWSDEQVENCVYDPRITKIDDEYIIMYASQAPGRGVRTGVVRTRDFECFERISQPETDQNNRNSVLFPEKINGRYVRFDRPMSDCELDPSDMCLSYSDDLVNWGDTQILMQPREGSWDSHKIGAGAVPIKTDQGWLEIYHAVDQTCNGFIYRLGVMLLDLDDPSKIIARGQHPVLWPEHDYEFNGRVPNVTFACNALLQDDGTVRVYYGAADTCIGLAEAKLSDLLDACYATDRHLERFFGTVEKPSSVQQPAELCV